MRPWMAVVVLLSVCGSAPFAAAQAGSGYGCPWPTNHDAPLRDVGMGVCNGWILVWYYPPGLYQAWCILTGDCPA